MFAGTLRGVESAAEAVWGESPTLIDMGGQKQAHPLGEIYCTTPPFRHGNYGAKLSLAPVSPELVAVKDREVAMRGRPNDLREESIDFFVDTGGEWELRTDADTMPIEDASAEWP